MFLKDMCLFDNHLPIAIWIIVRKRTQIVDFPAHVTFQFDGWRGKTIGHLFYAPSCFVHRFVTVCEFPTGVTVRKRSIQVKIVDFLGVYLEFDGRLRKRIKHIFYTLQALGIIP